MSSWTIKEQSCLPNKGLKCTSRFRGWWVESRGDRQPFFYNVCFCGIGSLVAEIVRYQVAIPNQSTFSPLAVAWKRALSMPRWRLKWGKISLLRGDDPFSGHRSLLLPFSGPWELHSLNLFSLFSFSFSNLYNTIQSCPFVRNISIHLLLRNQL